MTSGQFSDWFRKQRLKKKLSMKEFKTKVGLKKSYSWFCNFERTGEFAEAELEILNKIAEYFGYHLALVPIRESLSEGEQKIIHEQYKEVENERLEKKIESKNW